MRFLFLALHQKICLEPPFPKTIKEFKERISVNIKSGRQCGITKCVEKTRLQIRSLSCYESFTYRGILIEKQTNF